MNIENYDEMLSQIIKMTIQGEEHLGKNLKQECIEYIEKLEKELENKNNEIDCLKDQIEWWKQQCDDLEMQVGE